MSEFKKGGNHSYAILFLKVLKDQDAQHVASDLKNIWHQYEMLKKGVLVDIPDSRVPTGRLSVLIGFGPEIFKTPKVKKSNSSNNRRIFTIVPLMNR